MLTPPVSSAVWVYVVETFLVSEVMAGPPSYHNHVTSLTLLLVKKIVNMSLLENVKKRKKMEHGPESVSVAYIQYIV